MTNSRELALRPAAVATALTLLAAAVLLGGCGKEQAASPVAPPRSVAAATVVLASSDVPSMTVLSGTVVSSNQVQVASRLMGYIRAVHVREGQQVKAGQVLLDVDPSDIQGQVEQARAGLAQAEAGLAQAKADEQRFGDLYRAEAIPRQQWEQVQLRYQVAQQQVAAARAGLATAGAQMRYASVRSPIDGVVVQKMTNPGDLAAPGRPLLVVEGQGALQVQTQLPDSVWSHVKVGDAVQVWAGERVLQGRLAQLVPVADPMSRTHEAKIDLPAGSGLTSGAFVRVGFAAGQGAQLQVPRSAVVDRAGMTGVFVVDAQHVAHFRLVRLGAEAGPLVDVQAGLRPGETVVTSHLDALENGVRISGGDRG